MAWAADGTLVDETVLPPTKGVAAGYVPVTQSDGSILWDSPGAASVPDADGSTKGKVQLAGDLAGTAASPQIATGVIVNADINASAAIALSKLATDPSNASNLASGTVPDARFPATLPAASGVNLTALNATNLGSGTVPDARFPAVLPAISGANLTNLPGGSGGGIDPVLSYMNVAP